MKYHLGFVIIFGFLNSHAAIRVSDRSLERVVQNFKSNEQMMNALIQRGLYFSAIPFAKEVISSKRFQGVNRRFGPNIERLIAQVGVRQFETLPDSLLSRYSVSAIRYIRAKKYFRRGRYKDTINVLRRISNQSSIAPFATMLRGSAYSILGDFRRAISSFDQCSGSHWHPFRKSDIRKQQYEITQDYCLIGKARSLFALRRYKEATSTYLDLEKKSSVWPEILFEEGWSSFFQKDYNRTLGKIVTYKAPVFQNFFVPEISVLESLAYMELCLWSDAKKTIDLFYSKYARPARDLGGYIRSRGKNYQYFYKDSRVAKNRKVQGGPLYNKLLRSIIFEPGYQELDHTLMRGKKELARIKFSRSSKVKKILLPRIKDTLNSSKEACWKLYKKETTRKIWTFKKIDNSDELY